MDAIQVSEAAAKPHIAVVNREVLWDNGVVAVRVPEGATEMISGELHYLQFPRFLKGGVVNMFVHIPGGTDFVPGKTIRARAKVKRLSRQRFGRWPEVLAHRSSSGGRRNSGHASDRRGSRDDED